jgi:arylsulfatase A-like enzyme
VRAIRTRRWKYIERFKQDPNELYDLKNDPGELNNLVADPNHAGTRKELSRRVTVHRSNSKPLIHADKR